MGRGSRSDQQTSLTAGEIRAGLRTRSAAPAWTEDADPVVPFRDRELLSEAVKLSARQNAEPPRPDDLAEHGVGEVITSLTHSRYRDTEEFRTGSASDFDRVVARAELAVGLRGSDPVFVGYVLYNGRGEAGLDTSNTTVGADLDTILNKLNSRVAELTPNAEDVGMDDEFITRAQVYEAVEARARLDPSLPA